MMKTAGVTSSVTTFEVCVCPAARVGSVAQGTPCVVQETAAATVSRKIPSEMNKDCFYHHVVAHIKYKTVFWEV